MDSFTPLIFTSGHTWWTHTCGWAHTYYIYIYSIMMTSSLWCGRVYILYINLVCRNDAIIMQYIIYSILEWSYIQNIGPVVGVLGCDIALGPSGYITSLDTHHRSYIMYIRPNSILYNIHIFVRTWKTSCSLYTLCWKNTLLSNHFRPRM